MQNAYRCCTALSLFVIPTEVEESLVNQIIRDVSTSLDMTGGFGRLTSSNAYRARYIADWTRRDRCAVKKRSRNSLERMDCPRRDGHWGRYTRGGIKRLVRSRSTRRHQSHHYRSALRRSGQCRRPPRYTLIHYCSHTGHQRKQCE